MSARIRIAVRKFEPFESAIARQFADFTRTSGVDARLEIEALDLNPLHDTLFTRRGLADGSFDLAFLATDWLAQAQSAGLIRDLTPHLSAAPIPDFPDAWSPSLLNLQRFQGGFWGMPDLPHSIHYLDLIRALAGNPQGVLARTYGYPATDLAQTRTSAILDYGSDLRVTLSINHHHDFGRRFQDASFRFEGDCGAALVKLGLLLNYPDGEPDELWLAPRGGPWERVPLAGSWFPDAFIGTMSNLQRFAAGEDTVLYSSVEDAWHTMALVEACYRSNASRATPVPVSE